MPNRLPSTICHLPSFSGSDLELHTETIAIYMDQNNLHQRQGHQCRFNPTCSAWFPYTPSEVDPDQHECSEQWMQYLALGGGNRIEVLRVNVDGGQSESVLSMELSAVHANDQSRPDEIICLAWTFHGSIYGEKGVLAAGPMLAVGGISGHIHLISMAKKGEAWGCLRGHGGAITALTWSNSSEESFARLASASTDQTVRIWTISHHLATPMGDHLSTKFALMGGVSSGGGYRVISRTSQINANVTALAFQPGSDRGLAIGCKNGNISIWREGIHRWEMAHYIYQLHKKPVSMMIWLSKDHFVSVCDRRCVRWRLRDATASIQIDENDKEAYLLDISIVLDVRRPSKQDSLANDSNRMHERQAPYVSLRQTDGQLLLAYMSSYRCRDSPVALRVADVHAEEEKSVRGRELFVFDSRVHAGSPYHNMDAAPQSFVSCASATMHPDLVDIKANADHSIWSVLAKDGRISFYCLSH